MDSDKELARVAEFYKGQGIDVVVHPDADALPSFAKLTVTLVSARTLTTASLPLLMPVARQDDPASDCGCGANVASGAPSPPSRLSSPPLTR